jgi:hypothetical protein
MSRVNVYVTIGMMLLFTGLWLVMRVTATGLLFWGEGPEALDATEQRYLTCNYVTSSVTVRRSFRHDQANAQGRSNCPIVIKLCDPAFANEGPIPSSNEPLDICTRG